MRHDKRRAALHIELDAYLDGAHVDDVTVILRDLERAARDYSHRYGRDQDPRDIRTSRLLMALAALLIHTINVRYVDAGLIVDGIAAGDELADQVAELDRRPWSVRSDGM